MAPAAAGAALAVLLAEPAGGYDAAAPQLDGTAPADTAPGDRAPVAGAPPPAVEVAAAVDGLVATPVEGRGEAELSAELAIVEEAVRRLEARKCRLAGQLAAQRAAEARQQARQTGQDGQRAGQLARRQLEQELAEQHRWSKSDAKRTMEVGGQLTGGPLGDAPGAQAAFDEGALPPRHAKLLADTLAQLVGEPREQAATRLLAAAGEQDATTFGRTCRRVLAELDGPAALEAEQRRFHRRRAAVTTTEDGMLAVSGQWSGLDGEVIATAIDAFRTPDDPQQTGGRSPAQRTADAIVELARAALRAGEAPAVHGVRPQVTVTLDYQALLADAAAADDGQPAAAGVAETTWLGPLPIAEIRRLLADAGVARLLIDPDGVPVEAGERVRTVPAGLWRALVERDHGCIAVGCDAPAGWCDVMHLDRPFRLNGRLSLDNAALGCRHHHRAYDLNNWQVSWHQRRPRLHPPNQRPRGPDH